jgi:hypothetical protein
MFSIFDAGTAEVLGLKLRAGRQQFAVVGDGGTIPFYLHPVTVQLGADRFRMEMVLRWCKVTKVETSRPTVRSPHSEIGYPLGVPDSIGAPFPRSADSPVARFSAFRNVAR